MSDTENQNNTHIVSHEVLGRLGKLELEMQGMKEHVLEIKSILLEGRPKSQDDTTLAKKASAITAPDTADSLVSLPQQIKDQTREVPKKYVSFSENDLEEKSFDQKDSFASSSSLLSSTQSVEFEGWARVFFQGRSDRLAQQLLPTNSSTIARESYLFVSCLAIMLLMQGWIVWVGNLQGVVLQGHRNSIQWGWKGWQRSSPATSAFIRDKECEGTRCEH